MPWMIVSCLPTCPAVPVPHLPVDGHGGCAAGNGGAGGGGAGGAGRQRWWCQWRFCRRSRWRRSAAATAAACGGDRGQRCQRRARRCRRERSTGPGGSWAGRCGSPGSTGAVRGLIRKGSGTGAAAAAAAAWKAAMATGLGERGGGAVRAVRAAGLLDEQRGVGVGKAAVAGEEDKELWVMAWSWCGFRLCAALHTTPCLPAGVAMGQR